MVREATITFVAVCVTSTEISPSTDTDTAITTAESSPSTSNTTWPRAVAESAASTDPASTFTYPFFCPAGSTAAISIEAGRTVLAARISLPSPSTPALSNIDLVKQGVTGEVSGAFSSKPCSDKYFPCSAAPRHCVSKDSNLPTGNLAAENMAFMLLITLGIELPPPDMMTWRTSEAAQPACASSALTPLFSCMKGVVSRSSNLARLSLWLKSTPSQRLSMSNIVSAPVDRDFIAFSHSVRSRIIERLLSSQGNFALRAKSLAQCAATRLTNTLPQTSGRVEDATGRNMPPLTLYRDTFVWLQPMSSTTVLPGGKLASSSWCAMSAATESSMHALTLMPPACAASVRRLRMSASRV
mmetsp:Transcript_5340/g.11798  ORF Transcript_5340/g.11798 Transcript_5340/m.11798 type:complete len:356 (+) Transcript_5340:112-1179(+)